MISDHGIDRNQDMTHRHFGATTAGREIKNVLYELVARIAKAMASPKRLELLELLSQAPKSVETLAREADITVTLASAHLKELRATRLVETERRGKNIIYRLASPDIARLWVSLRMLAEDRLFELQEAMRELGAPDSAWHGEKREVLLRKARKGEVVVLDVRPSAEYAAQHLPFARSLPLAELRHRLAELPRDRPIVAYCRGPFCLMSDEAVKLLVRRGFRVSKLADGVSEWMAAGLPLESGAR
jgi:rhodanese-related sulfurtransferase/DNA-binding MarR family transcriptional regulator